MLHRQDLNIWIILLFFDFLNFLDRWLISIEKKLFPAINCNDIFLDFNNLQIIKNKIYSNLISRWILLIDFYWEETLAFIIYFECIFLPIGTSWEHAYSSNFGWVVVVSIWVICLFHFFELIGFVFILIITNFEDLHELSKINFIVNLIKSLFMKLITNIFNIEKTEIMIIFRILNFIVVNKWKPLRSWIWVINNSLKCQLMGRNLHFALHL